jgi:hypothetical protein
MIDKLTLTSGDMDFEALKRAFGETSTTRLLNKHYGFCQCVSTKKGKHLFTAYAAPKNSLVSPYRLELNPAKLGINYWVLMDIMGRGMNIKDARIKRIDHFADHEINVIDAYETIRLKHKRAAKGYRDMTDYLNGELTGFSIGSATEQMVIYNKTFEARWRKGEVPLGLTGHPSLTRFEMRHTKKKLPCTSLVDIPSLQFFDPFSSLEMLELKSKGNEFEPFRSKSRRHGLHSTFKALNKHNNFKRDVAKFFSVMSLPSYLSQQYKKGINEFIRVLDEKESLLGRKQ